MAYYEQIGFNNLWEYYFHRCCQVTNLTGSRQCRKEIITMFLAFFFIDTNGSPALGVVYNRVGSSVDMTIWMAHAEA